MAFIFWLLLIIIFCCIWYAVKVEGTSHKPRPEINRLQRKLKIEGNFKPDLYHFNNYNFYIGVNHKDKEFKIYLDDSRSPNVDSGYSYYTKMIDFKDVVSVEIIEDNMTISKTNRKSQLIGAGVGGVLAGGVGAIIGGMSGKSSSTNEVQNVTLRLIVNSFNKSVYDIPFLQLKDSIKKTDSEYKNAIDSAYRWHNVISKIIKDEENQQESVMSDSNVSQDDTSNHDDSTSTNQVDYIKEIERLASLKDNGIIDEIEFKKLKSKLID